MNTFTPGQIVRPVTYNPKDHDDIRGMVIETVHAKTLNGEKLNVLVRWISPGGSINSDTEWYHPTELKPAGTIVAAPPSPPA